MSSKKTSLSLMALEFVSLLPMNLRCEIEANNRKGYSFVEQASLQGQLLEYFKKLFPPGRKQRIKGKDSNCQTLGTLSSHGIDRIDALIGKCTGESAETVRRRRLIHNAAKEDQEKYSKLINRIDGGVTSIDYAARMIENEKRKQAPTPKLPAGEYNLIYIDPPWSYDIQLSGSPEFKTMSHEELKKIKLPASKSCIVFLWATNPKLSEAIELLLSWGFEYKTNMVWVKTDKVGGKLKPTTGHYFFGAHELLLIGTRGSPGTPAEGDRIPSVLFAPVTRHSQKPTAMKQIINELYPRAQKLEMFARRRAEYDNETWTYWGDQLE